MINVTFTQEKKQVTNPIRDFMNQWTKYAIESGQLKPAENVGTLEKGIMRISDSASFEIEFDLPNHS